MSKIALARRTWLQSDLLRPSVQHCCACVRRNDWFVDQINRLGARRVLELGSGTGETAAYLASHSDAEIVAVEYQQGIRGRSQCAAPCAEPALRVI